MASCALCHQVLIQVALLTLCCSSVLDWPFFPSIFLQFLLQPWVEAMLQLWVRVSLCVFQTTFELAILQYKLMACYASQEWLDMDPAHFPLP